jgi:hypothetical protein
LGTPWEIQTCSAIVEISKVWPSRSLVSAMAYKEYGNRRVWNEVVKLQRRWFFEGWFTKVGGVQVSDVHIRFGSRLCNMTDLQCQNAFDAVAGVLGVPTVTPKVDAGI